LVYSLAGAGSNRSKPVRFDMMGLSADIAYKPNLRKPNLSAKMYIIRKGKIKPLTGYLRY
jgi:hypothetical protein